jgi:hypothetical protein
MPDYGDRYGVHVAERDMLRRTVRLVLWRELGDGRIEVFCDDGTVQAIGEHEVGPENAGWQIPHEALPAFAKALGHHAPHAVEIKRLEEALKVERDRVDRALASAIGAIR